MPTPEQELQTYKAIHTKLQSSPELNRKWLRLYKEAYPEASIPELDTQDRFEKDLSEKLKERDDKISKLEERLMKKEFEDKFTSDRSALAGPPWFLGDDQVKMVDELVEKKGFPSLELAADYLRATSEPLKPSSLGLSGFSPTKTAREERTSFNERYQKIFKKGKNNFKKVFDDAYNKAFVTGEYVKEMQQGQR